MNKLEIIYTYYPRGISYYSGDYEGTDQYALVSEKINLNSPAWSDFIDTCIEEFGVDSVDDRTNNELGFVFSFKDRC